MDNETFFKYILLANMVIVNVLKNVHRDDDGELLVYLSDTELNEMEIVQSLLTDAICIGLGRIEE